MQPTGFRVRSVFVFLADTEAARRYERGTGTHNQGLVVQVAEGNYPMRSQTIRIMTAVASIAALALAGGASIKGF